jgi:hypothetical protein
LTDWPTTNPCALEVVKVATFEVSCLVVTENEGPSCRKLDSVAATVAISVVGFGVVPPRSEYPTKFDEALEDHESATL